MCGVRTREGDVFADGAVEEERILQDDADLRPVGIEPRGREVNPIDADAARRGDVESGNEPDDGRFARA